MIDGVAHTLCLPRIKKGFEESGLENALRLQALCSAKALFFQYPSAL